MLKPPASRLLPVNEPYAPFAARLQQELGYAAPWVDGRPAVRSSPIVVSASLWAELRRAAEAMAGAFDEVVRRLVAEPELFEVWMQPTPHQRLMWLASGGLWHGFARIDLFLCMDGRVQMAELNADTPTGQVEAVELGAMVAAAHAGLIDPNAGYRARFLAMVRRLHDAQMGVGAPIDRVAILYPTDIPEDLAVVRMLQRWLEEVGSAVVIGSPYNLELDGEGHLCVFGQPVDVVLRHYKTDWWTERPPLFIDEPPLADAAALEGPLWAILSAERARRVTVVNPFGAMAAQNKRAMALLWELRETFSAEAQAAVEAWLPETRRVDDAMRHELLSEPSAWVLKSDYGCEGEEVLVGRATTPEVWRAAVDRLVPSAWIAQRYFEVAPLDGESLPNYGVYLVAGEAAGLYVRLDPMGSLTDTLSCAAPALVEPC